MRAYVEEYLEDQKSAWSETTLRSERSRLLSLGDKITLTPAELYKALVLEGRKAYSIKTMFVRLCNLEAWTVQNKKQTETPFKDFMYKHRNRFKHAYSKEDVGVTFDEALKLIQTLPGPSKELAEDMLKTGLRMDEVFKVQDGKVIGKGGKPRTVYGKIRATVPRSTFARHLARVGLKPHTLRKLWATRLAEKGATPQDLCKAAGWSSINTAYHYLQAKNDDRLHDFIKKATKG